VVWKPVKQTTNPSQKSAKPKRKPSRARQTANKYEWRGTTFASGFERDFAKQLTKWGLSWEYEKDSFYWFPNPRVYNPDFKITKDDGSVYYIETKGFFDPNSRAKMACIKKQFPDVDIRMVFMDPNKKVTKSKTGKTYGQWAEKAGYDWSSFCIPTEWRNGCIPTEDNEDKE
jgi:predicted nuclease of restriction endonuclease-like RecB superfamily